GLLCDWQRGPHSFRTRRSSALGGTYGSFHLVDSHPELFAGAKTAISEVGGYSIQIGDERAYLIQTAEKSMDWIRLRARGGAAHRSDEHTSELQSREKLVCRLVL